MARLFTCGFETGSTEWNGGQSGTGTTLTVTTTQKRTGSYSLSIYLATVSGHIRQILDSNKTELFGRVAVRLDSGASQRTFTLLDFRDSNNAKQAQLDYNSGTGCLDWVDNNDNIIGVGSVVIPADTWVVIEFRVAVGASGSLTAKVNGTTSTAFSGDTDFSGQNDLRSIYFRLEEGSGVATIYLDDIAINDTEGSYQNSWAGLGGVFFLEPTADGDTTDWTPSTGSDNYAMVDDIPPDNATTYNQAVTTGTTDLYQVDDCPEYIAQINLVQVVYRAALATSGYNEITDLVKVAGTVYSGSESTIVPITPSYQMYLGTAHYINPNTAAPWGTAEVNAMQAGVETTT